MRLQHDLQGSPLRLRGEGERLRRAIEGEPVRRELPDTDFAGEHQAGGQILHVDGGAVGREDLLLRGAQDAQIHLGRFSRGRRREHHDTPARPNGVSKARSRLPMRLKCHEGWVPSANCVL